MSENDGGPHWGMDGGVFPRRRYAEAAATVALDSGESGTRPDIEGMVEEIRSLKEALRQQRERLLPWLRHRTDCRVATVDTGGIRVIFPDPQWFPGDEADCDCGLAEALGLGGHADGGER